MSFVLYPSRSRRRRTAPLRHQPRHHCCGAETTDVNKIVGKRAGERAGGQRPADERRRHRSISIYRRSNVDECFPTGHHGRRPGRTLRGRPTTLTPLRQPTTAATAGPRSYWRIDGEMLRRSAPRSVTSFNAHRPDLAPCN